ncbi:hypothetical protein DXD25_15560 [Prevotella sp. TF12-30]|nr:hypothetical protein DXD25_15560 [Prevotella sp. TF12-30]
MSRIKTIFFILLFIFIATKIQIFFLFSAKISNFLTPPIAIGYKSCCGNFVFKDVTDNYKKTYPHIKKVELQAICAIEELEPDK